MSDLVLPAPRRSWRSVLDVKHSVLPGFSLALGYSVIYLGLIVLIPLSSVFLRSAPPSPWLPCWRCWPC